MITVLQNRGLRDMSKRQDHRWMWVIRALALHDSPVSFKHPLRAATVITNRHSGHCRVNRWIALAEAEYLQLLSFLLPKIDKAVQL